jgi:TonB family protein
MRLGLWRASTAVVLLVLCAAPRGSAQPIAALDEVLKLPLTPGAVALLFQHAAQPAALVQLGAALRHPDAAVRAAGARILFVVGARGMASPMMVALDGETSPQAAVEEIRYLVHLGSPDHRSTIEKAMTRLGPEVASAAALELVRSEGPSVLSRVGTFRAAGVSKETFGRIFGIASNDDPLVFERALTDAVAARDEFMVGAVLDAAVARRVSTLPEALVLSVVSSMAPAVSIEGVWYLARSWDGVRRWDPRVLTAMQTALEDQGDDPGTSVLFAREIISRLQGRRPAASAEWLTLLSSADLSLRFLFERPFSVEVLSGRELELVAARLGVSSKQMKDTARRKQSRTPKAPPASAYPLPSMEAVSGYPPGFTTDVFRVTGCRLDAEMDRSRSDGATGGVLTLREYGRAAAISLMTSRVAQPGCMKATQVLLSTAVDPPRDSEPVTQKTLMVTLDPAYFACQEASHGRPDAPRRIGQASRIKQPTKTLNVPPIYPPTAIEDRVQGIVILEATISHEGCISSVRVVRGVDGRLDWSAIRSVLQWRFTPPLLDGTPVPVIMTVTVQFSLS